MLNPFDQLPPLYAIAFAALFGLLLGSFLNVVVYRLPRDLNVAWPGSHCPFCEKPIAWFDNLPVLSYLLLGGRCRSCRAGIPWRYPVLEASTGLVFAAAVWRLGPTVDALKLCLFAALMLALVFMDLETFILADEITLGGTALGLALSLFLPMPRFLSLLVFPAEWSLSLRSFAESALGAALPALALWGIGKAYELVRRREGMGFGDVKMMALIGAFYNLQAALLTLMLASVLGSVIGLAVITLTRKDAATTEIPFGTFLGLAALLPPFLWPDVANKLISPWPF